MLHIAIVVYVITLLSWAGLYKIFEKAGEKGWKAFVPVYNYVTWLKILKRPWWWVFLFIIPGVGFMMNMVVSGITTLAMEKKKEFDTLAAFIMCALFVLLVIAVFSIISVSGTVRFGLVAGLGYLGYQSFKVFFALLGNKKEQVEAPTVRAIIWGILFFISLPYYGFSKLAFLPDAGEASTDKEKRSIGMEWTEAIAFAIVAATIIRTFFLEAYTIPTPSMEKSLMVGDYLFVSKVNYGARIPLTPISFPFVQNSLPGTQTTPSYLDWIEYPPLRLPGFSSIKRHDIVVFNFPDGDTVPSNISNPSFYSLCRRFGRDKVMANQSLDYPNGASMGIPGKLLIRPIDKEENYIKRCIGTPGDTLTVKRGQVYINGKPDDVPGAAEFYYKVSFNGRMTLYNGRNADEDNPNEGKQYDVDVNNATVINKSLLNSMDITEAMQPSDDDHSLIFTLTRENAEKLKSVPGIASVTPSLRDSGNFIPGYDDDIFPSSRHFNWNVDNFGPLWVPKKGATVNLTIDNLPLYKRIITAYEHNDLQVRNGQIFINGSPASSYTFKMDYYFMMGDNRHNSEDSRYWGFVPYDHVVGKASFVWMSLKKDVPFKQKFRWKRFFTFVNNEGLSRSYLIPFLIIAVLAIAYSYFKNMRKSKQS